MKKNNKNNKIGIIAIIAILAIAILLIGTHGALTIAFPQQINGGTILGVSYLQFFSNFNQLNGVPAYLVNLVVNNGGESLQGTINSYSTSTGSLTNNINSYSNTNYQASNPSQQVSIDTKLNSLSESIPYDYAGYHLYEYYYNNESLSYQLPNAPIGLICNSGETNKKVFVGCFDYNDGITGGVSTLAPTVSGFVQTLANDCQSQYTDGVLTVQNSSTNFLSTLGVNLASELFYNVTCVQPYMGEIGIVLNPSTGNYNYNVSVYFSNSTFSKTLYLSSYNPQTNYDNILYAQVYGVAPTGQGILTTSAPTLIQFNNGTSAFVNEFSTATGLGEAYSQYTPAYEPITVSNLNIQPYGIENGAYVIQNAYSLNNLKAQIQNNNEKVANLLTPLQPSNPYSGIQYNPSSGNASINLMANPPVYPEVQLIARVSTLGLFQAVTEPKLISINPNPVQFRTNSETQITLTVQNLQDVAGSFYGSGYCGSSQFSIPNTPIGASATVTTEPITVQSPVNNNLYNSEGVNCYATVYSSYGIYNSSMSFNGTVSPECSAGTIYQNNTNCKSEFPTTTGQGNSSCIEGYYNKNGECVEIPPSCTGNETANYSTFPAHCNNGGGSNLNLTQIIEYAIIGIVVIAVIYLIASSRNKNNGYGNNGYRNYNRNRR